jgi:hypothetical protein
MMAERTIPSPWTRAAAKRWPGYFVEGDGPVAVVYRSLNSVRLFDFELLAQAYIEESPNAKELTMHRLVPDYAAPYKSNAGRMPLRVTADTYEREK